MKHNIITGEGPDKLPAMIDGTTPPMEAQLQAAGWRDFPDKPEPEAGYTRISIKPVEGDGVTGAWQVVDRLTAEIEAEQAAAKHAQAAEEFKANIPRYTLQNIYILLCDTVFVTDKRVARGTEELLAKAKELQAAGQKDAVINLAMLIIGLNTELVREVGVRWWDECHWTEQSDIVAAAEAKLKEMMA